MAQSDTRSEVPIRQVVLSDGTRRYAIAIELAGHRIDAGLDSGSIGLRALHRKALAGGIAMAGGGTQRYGFGSGTVLEGPAASGILGVGASRGTIRLQDVHAATCGALQPGCPASHLPFDQFRIQGNGLPGEGFSALFGIGLFRGDISNPLVQLGVRRWIIRLPRPGDTEPGVLILNPDDAETAGFVALPLAAPGEARRNDGLAACLTGAGGRDICAPTIVDTGAPGIELVNHAGSRGRGAGPLTLRFGKDSGDARATIRFDPDQRAQASRLSVTRDPRVDGPMIRSGLIVYLCYDVLYDSAAHTIAVRTRPAYAGGPAATTIADHAVRTSARAGDRPKPIRYGYCKTRYTADRLSRRSNDNYQPLYCSFHQFAWPLPNKFPVVRCAAKRLSQAKPVIRSSVTPNEAVYV